MGGETASPAPAPSARRPPGAVATLVTASLVGGWDAVAIGVPAALVDLVVGVIPYLLALGKRVSSKRRLRERIVHTEA